MRLYRIDRRSQPGSLWAGTQDDAKRLAKEEGSGWETAEVPTDKAGLLAFLNVEGSVATETAKLNDELSRAPPPRPAAAPGPSYTHQSVAIDDAWDALPLARKLHFAALAMEDARAQL